jgi:DNA-binding beta-propeller fold protein YncE
MPAQAGGAHAEQRRTAGRGWQVFLTGSMVRRPTGVAIDLRGARHAAQWGYVADAGTGRIVKFGTGGRVLRSWRYAPPGHPAALTVGGSGNLFVADELGGTISKFSPNGKRLAFWTPESIMPQAVPPYTDPRGGAIDPEGKIYVAEYSADSIIQLSPGGTLLQAWDTSKGFTTQYSVPH